jgi:hypothetical protein
MHLHSQHKLPYRLGTSDVVRDFMQCAHACFPAGYRELKAPYGIKDIFHALLAYRLQYIVVLVIDIVQCHTNDYDDLCECHNAHVQRRCALANAREHLCDIFLYVYGSFCNTSLWSTAMTPPELSVCRLCKSSLLQYATPHRIT